MRSERLGARQLGRAQWAEQTLATIHDSMRDRVTCAVERSGEELLEELARKLSRSELPAPGELEGELENLAGQIEHFLEQGIQRTHRALDGFEAELQGANAALLPELEDALSQVEQARRQLAMRAEAVFAQELDAPLLALEGDWEERAAYEVRLESWRAALLDLVNEARDGLAPAARRIPRALDDQGELSEDAWDDLQRQLGRVRSEVGDNCWKLEGPHLDGRFPRTENEEREPGIAMLER